MSKEKADKDIIKEAILELNRVKQEAVEIAKQTLAESMPDKLEKIIKETLNKKSINECECSDEEVKKEEPIIDKVEIKSESEETPAGDDGNKEETFDFAEGEDVDLTTSDDDNVEATFDNLGDDSDLEIKKDDNDDNISMEEIEEALMKMESEDDGNSDEAIDIDIKGLDNDKPEGEETIIDKVEPSEDEVEEGQSRTLSNAKKQTIKPEGFKEYAADKLRDGQRNEGVAKTKIATLMENNKKLNKQINALLKAKQDISAINEEYKNVLKQYKDKLYEMSIFNTNLAHVNNLFVEHTTTNDEKKNIIKRFKNIQTIDESKKTYNNIITELKSKAPITETLDKETTKSIKSAGSTIITESTAYDEQVNKIKNIMNKIEGKRD